MSARRGPPPVAERLRRLLVMLPWLADHGDTPVAELAARFGATEQQIIDDITLASLCGLPPFVEEMIDVYEDEGMVYVGVPRIFTRPLRLTAREGLALLVAVRAAMELPGADPEGPLARAADKLAAVVGDPELAVDVEAPPFLELVREAAEQGERLVVQYYAASRDETTQRTIDPHLVFLDRGHWYVAADDSASGALRYFRVDRISEAASTGEHFTRRAVTQPPPEWFTLHETMSTTVHLPPAARWVVETYPVRDVRPREDGSFEVDLAVASERWLAKLLLRVGPEAEVLAPPELRQVAPEAAARVLARYREG